MVPLSVSSSQHLKGSKIPSENCVQGYNRERNSRKAGQYLIAAHSKRSIECGVPFPRGFSEISIDGKKHKSKKKREKTFLACYTFGQVHSGVLQVKKSEKEEKEVRV